MFTRQSEAVKTGSIITNLKGKKLRYRMSLLV